MAVLNRTARLRILLLLSLILPSAVMTSCGNISGSGSEVVTVPETPPQAPDAPAAPSPARTPTPEPVVAPPVVVMPPAPVTPPVAVTPPAPVTPPVAVTPPSAAVRWRGVSLAGAEFAPAYLPGVHNRNYRYPDAASVAYFKAKGMDTVRLPFLWERLQPSLNQTFNPTEAARLTTLVRNITATGTSVILDPHNYARYRDSLIGSDAVPYSAFADFWSRLARQFRDNDRVVFGLMNEPHSMPTEQWLAAANAALAAIRTVGATNIVTVPGNAWSGAYSWDKDWYGTSNATVMKRIFDPGNNMVFEMHQYLDADSSGLNPTCVSATIGSERLQTVTKWLRTNGYRAFLGEMGTPANDTCNQALANMLDFMQVNADVWAGWTWWAAGPWWGDQMLSIEPSGNMDKPQMLVLDPYLK